MSNEEYLDAIDENNKVIGKNTKTDSYKYKIPHRIVHTMVVDRDKLYIPKRALSVRYLPGYYCSSAGGHVQAGEVVKSAALRELEEEIGLSGPIELLEEFFFTHEFKVHISLFIKKFDKVADKINVNGDEVLSGEFYDLSEILELDKSKFHPQFVPCLEKTILWLNDNP